MSTTAKRSLHVVPADKVQCVVCILVVTCGSPMSRYTSVSLSILTSLCLQLKLCHTSIIKWKGRQVGSLRLSLLQGASLERELKCLGLKSVVVVLGWQSGSGWLKGKSENPIVDYGDMCRGGFGLE